MTDNDASARTGRTSARRRRGTAGQGPTDLGATVGQNVRAERERQEISVRQLAKRVGVSASFLSQFELGQSKAAVNTLFAIATELGLSLDELLGRPVAQNRGTVAKGGARRALTEDGAADEFAEYLQLQNGVRWKRLAGTSPDHRVQFLLTEYDPGSDSAPGDAPQHHPGDDYGYVLKGTLTVDIDGARRTLSAGQAIHIPGHVPHRLRNLSDEPAQAIWCVVG